MRQQQKKVYTAIYEINGRIISEADFSATNKREAMKLAQFHKRRTPEILKFKRVKTTIN